MKDKAWAARPILALIEEWLAAISYCNCLGSDQEYDIKMFMFAEHRTEYRADLPNQICTLAGIGEYRKRYRHA